MEVQTMQLPYDYNTKKYENSSQGQRSRSNVTEIKLLLQFTIISK